MLTDVDGLAHVLSAIAAAGPAEDAGEAPDASIRAILRTGVLDETRPRQLARSLVRIAEANLPVARLAEGHVNALRLLRLQDERPPDGQLLGVWGAEADVPVSCRDGVLLGIKRYASGLGTVDAAVVTVGQGAECRLALVDTRDARRHRPAAWRMIGMRATRSGEIVLDGLVPRWIGRAGDYFVEPGFLGGTWRIAAVQAGGTLGLVGAARDVLSARDRLAAEAQVARLAPLLFRAWAAVGLIERSAEMAETSEGAADPDAAVALSLGARLMTETLAQDAIAAVERSVGLPHFEECSPTGRLARDLATYCRQAMGDAFLQKAGRIALERSGPLSASWYG